MSICPDPINFVGYVNRSQQARCFAWNY